MRGSQSSPKRAQYQSNLIQGRFWKYLAYNFAKWFTKMYESPHLVKLSTFCYIVARRPGHFYRILSTITPVFTFSSWPSKGIFIGSSKFDCRLKASLCHMPTVYIKGVSIKPCTRRKFPVSLLIHLCSIQMYVTQALDYTAATYKGLHLQYSSQKQGSSLSP